jgi:hypothetical protein
VDAVQALDGVHGDLRSEAKCVQALDGVHGGPRSEVHRGNTFGKADWHYLAATLTRSKVPRPRRSPYVAQPCNGRSSDGVDGDGVDGVQELDGVHALGWDAREARRRALRPVYRFCLSMGVNRPPCARHDRRLAKGPARLHGQPRNAGARPQARGAWAPRMNLRRASRG